MRNNFDKITVCVDMAGCPNKCRHCWIGVTENKGISVEQFKEIAEMFRKNISHFEIFSWYREPDFRADYRELCELEKHFSTNKTEHFELASFWRLVRDESYVKWLCEQGVKKCQLTLFGDEVTTDFYVGRKGAFQEIIKSIDILLENKIAPRIQVFVNQRNVFMLDSVVKMCRHMGLERRCAALGQKFEIFVHAGSCDGENAKLYDIRMESDDLSKIPEYLVKHTLEYMEKQSIEDVFGFSENYLYSEFHDWESYMYESSKSPVFYVDGNLDVYPNVTSTYPWWRIGNLKADGCETILKRYAENDYFAARMMKLCSFSDIVKVYGNKESRKLFELEDYYYYIWNMYMKEKYMIHEESERN